MFSDDNQCFKTSGSLEFTSMNYFHGSISAKTAERRLLTHKDDNKGLYLLRESQGSYIISYIETKHKNVGHILVPNSINSNGEPKTNFLKNNPQLQSVQDILEFMAPRCSGRIKMLCPLSKDEFKFDNEHHSRFSQIKMILFSFYGGTKRNVFRYSSSF